MMRAFQAASYSTPIGVSLAILLSTSAQAALTISDKATENVTCSARVCSATAKKAVLNVTDLTTMLAAGSLTVESGNQAQDILVEAPFSWTSVNALMLDADKSITVNNAVADSGPAALTLSYGKKGDLRFGANGDINFLSSSNALTINGQSYVLVSSIGDLAHKIKSTPSGYFALRQDYDANIDGNYKKSPVATPFSGKFEGLGNKISKFAADVAGNRPPQQIALFAELVSGGEISNVGVVDASVKRELGGRGALLAVGILVGDSEGVISNSYTTGVVIGERNTSNTGGLVGHSEGDILNSWSEASVSTGELVGGLVGLNEGKISKSHSSGPLGSALVSGGLVGENYEAGIIEYSHSTSTVQSGGGLVGGNSGNIVGSYANGNVSGGGGLVYVSVGNVTNCYATGAVAEGKFDDLGGLIDSTAGSGIVSGSYSVGKVQAVKYRGGLVGLDQQEGNIFENAYWDTDTSGVTDPSQGAGNVPNDPGITGLTDAQLKSSLPAGFDPKVWAQDAKINGGYPYLIANPPAE